MLRASPKGLQWQVSAGSEGEEEWVQQEVCSGPHDPLHSVCHLLVTFHPCSILFQTFHLIVLFYCLFVFLIETVLICRLGWSAVA